MGVLDLSPSAILRGILVNQSAEPHRVAFYLNDLASALHAQWNRGKDTPALRFVNAETRELTRARLALVDAVRAVIAQGLSALGVGAPDEMR